MFWKAINVCYHDRCLFSKSKRGQAPQAQGLKLLGFRMSRAPKNGDGNQILGPWFPTGNSGNVMPTDSLKLGVSDRKPRNCWGNPNTEAGFLNGDPNFNRNF